MKASRSNELFQPLVFDIIEHDVHKLYSQLINIDALPLHVYKIAPFLDKLLPSDQLTSVLDQMQDVNASRDDNVTHQVASRDRWPDSGAVPNQIPFQESTESVYRNRIGHHIVEKANNKYPMESIDQIPQMFVPQGIIPPIDELNPNLDPQNRNESNLTQTLGSIIDRRAPYDGNSEAKNALRNASIAGQDYAAKTNHVSRGFQVKIEKDQIGLTSGFVDAPCETKIAVMDGQNSNMNQLINQIEPQSRVNPNFSHPDSAKMPPHSNETLNNGLYNEEDIFNNEIEDNLDIISDTDEENVNEEANSFPNQMNGNFNSNKNLVKNPSHGSISD